MKNNRKSNRIIWGLVALVIFTTIAISFGTMSSHSQRDNSKKQDATSMKKPINDEDVPITDFNKSLSSETDENDKRQKKSKRRNLELGPKTGVFDAKRFMLTEERHSGYGGFETHSPVEPAIPAAKSDLVITGEITKAEAFLSEDKVSIYSEFTVNIDNILKNSTSQDVNIGDSIITSRGGGGVRFPSGKIIKEVFEGKPMPRVGSKYVMFLKYETDGNDYSLITAYELKSGKIIPLDGLDRNGRIIYQLTSHQSYKGASETDFLTLIQLAISTSKDLFEKDGQ